MGGRIAAIALLLVRATVRSRLVAAVIALLAAVVIGLPLTIRGDGTLDGAITVLVNYTLGAATLLLAAVSLGASASAIAREIASRRAQWVVVKPVRLAEVWLGQWLGLVGLNALLLAAAGAAIYGAVRWRVSREEAGADAARREVLAAYREVRPVPPPIDADARELLRQWESEGRYPASAPGPLLAEFARQQARAARATVAPGAARRWLFELPRRRAAPAGGVLQFRVFMEGARTEPVEGTWWLGTPDAPRQAGVPMAEAWRRHGRIDVPPALLAPGTTLAVTFANEAPPQGGHMMFDLTESTVLLLPAGGFAGNLARALALVLCRLALVAALGLTLGALFSPPVAVFCAAAVVLTSLVGRYVVAGAGDPIDLYYEEQALSPMTRRINAAGKVIVGALDAVAGPALSTPALEPAAAGRCVPPAAVAGAAVRLGLLYPAVLAALACGALARRELGLPGEGP